MNNACTLAESLITRSTVNGLAVVVTVAEIEAQGLDPRAVIANLRTVCDSQEQGDFRGAGWRVQVWA